MGDLISVLYLAIFILAGLCISRTVLCDEPSVVRIWLGCVLALLLLIWLPALWSFILGFTLLSQLTALATAVAIAALFVILRRRSGKPELPSGFQDYGMIVTLLPLFAIGVILLSTHTIVERGGALYVGQSTYGDLAMHLGFITSIAEQGTFPPMYSICPDTAVGYPFLSDSVSSTFYVLGASLRFATMLPAMFALLLVFMGVYLFFDRWLADKSVVRFATLLFFLGGGLGFAYFFDMLQEQPDNFLRIFSAFYETPTNYVVSGIKWVNPIADMLVPQRATLFGWAFLFPCLYLLYRGAMEQDRKSFLLLGVIAGGLPLIHTHSFLALGVISAFLFVRSICRREGLAQFWGYLLYAGIVAMLAGPQLLLFTFKQSNSFLQLHWNWANTTDGTVWFYMKNLGLLFLLLPTAIFAAEKKDRAFAGGAAVLWLLAEVVQFQPNTYDNNKLLFVCFAFACGLVGKWLVGAYRRLRSSEAPQAAGTKLLAVLVCTALFLSGILTLGREYVSEYQLIDADQNAAAKYVKEHTAPDATFLTANNHNNCIAALTGRNIVCGSGSYLFFHGVDYGAREAALAPMYERPAECFTLLSETYHVDYVLIGSSELYNYACDTDYFAANYPVFYENESVTIYDVSQAP